MYRVRFNAFPPTLVRGQCEIAVIKGYKVRFVRFRFDFDRKNRILAADLRGFVNENFVIEEIESEVMKF